MVNFKYKLILILLKAFLAVGHYKTSYIEDLCNSNSIAVLNLGSGNSNSSGIIKTSRNKIFLPNKNCTISIQPPLGYGVVLSVRFMYFNGRNYVRVHDMKSTVELSGYSDDVMEFQSYASEKKGLELNFFTQETVGKNVHSEMTFIATAYVSVEYNCGRKMFPCLNGRCVWKGLTCDNHNNCGDSSDEFSQRSNCGMLPPGAIAGIVVGSVILLLLLIVVPFACCRSRTRTRNNTTPPLLQSEPDGQYSINTEVQPQASTSVYQDLPPAYKP